MDPYFPFLGILILALDLWAVVNILQSAASVGAKVAWILVIALLPVVGLLVWLLLGPRSVTA